MRYKKVSDIELESQWSCSTWGGVNKKTLQLIMVMSIDRIPLILTIFIYLITSIPPEHEVLK